MKWKYDFPKSAVLCIMSQKIMALISKGKSVAEDLKFGNRHALDHGISTLSTKVI